MLENDVIAVIVVSNGRARLYLFEDDAIENFLNVILLNMVLLFFLAFWHWSDRHRCLDSLPETPVHFLIIIHKLLIFYIWFAAGWSVGSNWRNHWLLWSLERKSNYHSSCKYPQISI